MRSLGALTVALHASLLVLLAQGIHKRRDRVYLRPQQPFSIMDRSSGYHLPTYMMHLYRNFKSNFSSPSDNMELYTGQQADTVKSLMAKSKTFLLLFLRITNKQGQHDDGECIHVFIYFLFYHWSKSDLVLYHLKRAL